MIRKLIFNISALFSILVLVFLITLFSLVMYFNAPNLYHNNDKKFIIEHGLTLREVVNKLHQEKIIRNPTAFLYIAQIFKGYDPKVRYGEYFFEKNLSYYKILHKINRGYVAFRKVTLTEGSSLDTAIKTINSAYGLIGEMPTDITEGQLLPETYFYSYNDTKTATVKRMKAAMQKVIDEAWEQRDPSLPFKSKEEALILASIVEKEAAIPVERPKIASVFINRLQKGMRLQSDPTIIYSFTKGDKSLERPITRSDINNKSLFNTYYITGLPPSPICNPGVESIKAVLNPIKTNYLYFVASSQKGVHQFSDNLAQHNIYVTQYRKFLKDRKLARQIKAEGNNTEAQN